MHEQHVQKCRGLPSAFRWFPREAPLGTWCRREKSKTLATNPTPPAVPVPVQPTPTLTSSWGSGRSAFFETWWTTPQSVYRYTPVTNSLHLWVFRRRPGYPVHGSNTRVFSELLKRASTFSLKKPGDTREADIDVSTSDGSTSYKKGALPR